MTLEIHIKTDNSAFGEDYITKSQEIIRILKQIIQDIDQYDVGICRDINGNVVGSWCLS